MFSHEQKRDGMTLDSVPDMGSRAAEIDDPRVLVHRVLYRHGRIAQLFRDGEPQPLGERKRSLGALTGPTGQICTGSKSCSTQPAPKARAPAGRNARHNGARAKTASRGRKTGFDAGAAGLLQGRPRCRRHARHPAGSGQVRYDGGKVAVTPSTKFVHASPMTTIDIDILLAQDDLRTLLDGCEHAGTIRAHELADVIETHELSALEHEALLRELDKRGIEIVEEIVPACSQPSSNVRRSSCASRMSMSIVVMGDACTNFVLGVAATSPRQYRTCPDPAG